MGSATTAKAPRFEQLDSGRFASHQMRNWTPIDLKCAAIMMVSQMRQKIGTNQNVGSTARYALDA